MRLAPLLAGFVPDVFTASAVSCTSLSVYATRMNKEILDGIIIISLRPYM